MDSRRNFLFWAFLPLLLPAFLPARAYGKIRVVATVPDLAFLAKQIGGERVQVRALARGGQDLHAVPARPTFLLRISRADLFLELGLDAEHAWVPPLIYACRNKKVRPGGIGFVNCSAGIRPLEVPRSLSREQAGDLHPMGNPHYNLDPENMRIVARNIFLGLCRVDPAGKNAYQKGLAALMKRFDVKEKEWFRMARDLKGLAVVTYHLSWSYFARRFGIRVAGTIEPKPGIEPTPSHLAELLETMKRERVKVIIREPYYSEKIPCWLARKTGAVVVTLPNTAGWDGAGKTWFDLMDYILKSLRKAVGLPPEPPEKKEAGKAGAGKV